MSVSAFRDKNSKPTVEEMLQIVGSKRPLWESLCRFMADSYGLTGEVKYFGDSYGWMIWFRRGGRTLVSLFPRKETMTVQLVLSPAQAEAVLKLPISSLTRHRVEEAYPYPEGRWVNLHVETERDIADISEMLQVKCPLPKRRKRLGGETGAETPTSMSGQSSPSAQPAA